MPSIGVLEHFQKPTDKPTRRIKRSGGQSLVNRGMAVWIRENVLLQMLAQSLARTISQPYANSMSNTLNPTPNRGRAYIPEKLPANIDIRLGLIVQVPALPNQIRFRHV